MLVPLVHIGISSDETTRTACWQDFLLHRGQRQLADVANDGCPTIHTKPRPLRVHHFLKAAWLVAEYKQ
eukprot:scaffold345_cov134-Cylindrotheca_fusiformis.AAC.58